MNLEVLRRGWASLAAVVAVCSPPPARWPATGRRAAGTTSITIITITVASYRRDAAAAGPYYAPAPVYYAPAPRPVVVYPAPGLRTRRWPMPVVRPGYPRGGNLSIGVNVPLR